LLDCGDRDLLDCGDRDLLDGAMIAICSICCPIAR
jgi:hypothetical protein